jgi:hypothetical protein
MIRIKLDVMLAGWNYAGEFIHIEKRKRESHPFYDFRCALSGTRLPAWRLAGIR